MHFQKRKSIVLLKKIITPQLGTCTKFLLMKMTAQHAVFGRHTHTKQVPKYYLPNCIIAKGSQASKPRPSCSEFPERKYFRRTLNSVFLLVMFKKRDFFAGGGGEAVCVEFNCRKERKHVYIDFCFFPVFHIFHSS